MAKTTAAAVANYFLNKGASEGVPVRHLKLQKLVYFAYAWFAGNYKDELFPDDIEAWPLGPVVRELYLEFRECGKSPISKRAHVYDPDTGEQREAFEQDEDIRNFLDNIWTVYRLKSDSWLVSATHRQDEPWGEYVAKMGGPNKRRIPYSLIERIYQKKVESLEAA